jgi:hypothetical protein
MSDGQYDIDSDDNVFSFDPYDMLSSRLSARRAQTRLEFKDQVDAAGTSMESMSTPDHARYAIGDSDEQMDRGPASPDKGKQRVSMPMPIRPPTSIHDLFDVSPPGTSGIIMVPMSSSFAPSDFSSFTSSSSCVAEVEDLEVRRCLPQITQHLVRGVLETAHPQLFEPEVLLACEGS